MSLPAAILLASLTASQTTLIVLPLARAPDVDTALADVVQSLLTAELARTPGLTVVSSADVTRLLDLEADRAALGCQSDGGACTSEIAAALGATHSLTGSLVVDGEKLTLVASLLEVENAQTMARERISGVRIADFSTRMRPFVERLLATTLDRAAPSLPPLVVEPRMSDTDALKETLVVSLALVASTSVVALPWAALVGLMVAGLAPPLYLITLLPFVGTPLVPCATGAGAVLGLDVLDDGGDLSFGRALLTAAGAATAFALAAPVVFAASLFTGNFAYNAFVGPIRTIDDSNEATRLTFVIALALTPALIAAAGLGGGVGSIIGVALFGEPVVLDEGVSEPSPARGATSDTPR